jgi:hypothetical protein
MYNFKGDFEGRSRLTVWSPSVGPNLAADEPLVGLVFFGSGVWVGFTVNGCIQTEKNLSHVNTVMSPHIRELGS